MDDTSIAAMPQLLGHSSLNTRAIYTRVRPNPLSNITSSFGQEKQIHVIDLQQLTPFIYRVKYIHQCT